MHPDRYNTSDNNAQALSQSQCRTFTSKVDEEAGDIATTKDEIDSDEWFNEVFGNG